MKVLVSHAMAAVTSKDPGTLLSSMTDRMSQKEPKGKIKTWECDVDGDFRYLAQQYDGAAWIRPEVVKDAINLRLVWPTGAEPTQEIKGIFMGRFIEMILCHFGKTDFHEAKALPLV